jgi:hypothetical protein
MNKSAPGRVVLGVAVAAIVGLLGISACSRAGNGSAQTPADLSELSWDGQALEAIGFSSSDLAPLANISDTSTAGPSSAPGKGDLRRLPKHRRLALAFARHMLHGEAVVQTDEGTKTVVVQRGTVTAIDATSVTVRSTDGFTLTWKFGNPIHVIEHRTTVQPSAIAVGTEVGIAGAKDGGTAVARLIVVPGQLTK